MMKVVVKGNEAVVSANDFSEAHDISSESSADDEDRLLHSVVQGEEDAIDDGKLVNESFNQGISSFNPDIMFENIVNNYSMAKKVYGGALIRLLSGYSQNYIERNINIPEFKKELKKKISDKVEELKDSGILNKDKTVSEKGIKLASLVLYVEEIDKLLPKGIAGEKPHRKLSHYGEASSSRKYRRGDRYRDISIKESTKLAIRRGHANMLESDLMTHERQSKGQLQVIYAMDASGSMKGRKVEMCKKAGIALAYMGITQKDKIGLITFGSEIKEEIAPTSDFMMLIKAIARVTAAKQTDFKAMLHKAFELFGPGNYTKHLIVLTDAMPTVGNDPEAESLEEIAMIRSAGITVSFIGIGLEKKAKAFAEKAVEAGEGKLYLVKDAENLDAIVLEDYYSHS
ncbi:VWA domain-containing protein [Candidatus Woesearchaeota archaeon]|nr:VWA domain-containing protein [Candidatus Woesearchaeota archaeon]